MCGNEIPEAELKEENAKKWNAGEGVYVLSVWHGVCELTSNIWTIEEKDVGVVCVAKEGDVILGPRCGDKPGRIAELKEA
jgi:hypothetical protein